MKKRLISFFLVCGLLFMPILGLSETSFFSPLIEAPFFSDFFAPSKAATFLEEALAAGRRVRTLFQMDINDEALADLDEDLGQSVKIFNNLKMNTLYQPGYNGVTHWQQSIALGNRPLSTHSLTTTPTNAYITSNFLPNQVLAFTPKEVMGFFSTLIETVEKELNSIVGPGGADTSLTGLKVIISLFTSSMEEDATWADLTGDEGLASSLSLLGSYFEGIVNGINNHLGSLPAQPTMVMTSKFFAALRNCRVSTPVFTSVEDLPLGATMAQFQFYKEDLAGFLDIIGDWYTNEEVTEYFITFENLLAPLSNSPQITADEFSQTILSSFEVVKDLIDEALTGPITLSFWYHNDSSNQTILDRLTLHLPADFAFDEGESPVSLFAEYTRQEEGSARSHHLSLGFFQDYTKVVAKGIFTPQHVLADDGITTQKEASINLSLTLESKSFNQYDIKDQVSLSILQNQTTTENSEEETWTIDFALGALPNEDVTLSLTGTNSTIRFTVDTVSRINHTSDINTATSYTLNVTGDFGNATLLSADSSITSVAPRKVSLPKESQVTRLGQMDSDALATWFQTQQEGIIKNIENLEKFFPAP